MILTDQTNTEVGSSTYQCFLNRSGLAILAPLNYSPILINKYWYPVIQILPVWNQLTGIYKLLFLECVHLQSRQ